MDGAVINNMISSTKRLIWWDLPGREKPEISGCVIIFSVRGSISRLNIKGDKGQPCLVPLEIWKGWDNIFKLYTCAHGNKYKAREWVQ